MLAEWFIGDITEGIAHTGREGRDPQVRDRPSRCDAGGRGGAPRGGACAPRDRRADLDAHRARNTSRARAAEGVRVGGRRPVAGRDRPQRRHRRPRVPRGAARARLVPGNGPLRALRDPVVRGTGAHDRRALRAGLRRPDGAVARRRVLQRLAPARRRRVRPVALLPHLPGRAPRAAHRRASATPRSTPCSSTTRAGSSTCRARTDPHAGARRQTTSRVSTGPRPKPTSSPTTSTTDARQPRCNAPSNSRNTSPIARDGDRVVGMARLLSDGVCNAYLVDVWTLSVVPQPRESHRRWCVQLAARVPGQHIGLQTDDAQGFYARLGFRPQPEFLSLVVGDVARQRRQPLTTTVPAQGQALRARPS